MTRPGRRTRAGQGERPERQPRPHSDRDRGVALEALPGDLAQGAIPADVHDLGVVLRHVHAFGQGLQRTSRNAPPRSGMLPANPWCGTAAT